MQWATQNYGIDDGSQTMYERLGASPAPSLKFLRSDLSIQSIGAQSKSAMASTKSSSRNAHKMVIADEADFIHKVRNKFCKRRNNMAAVLIQAAARGYITRCWYRRLYEAKVGAVIRV